MKHSVFVVLFFQMMSILKMVNGIVSVGVNTRKAKDNISQFGIQVFS
ncbi:hypothetical protein [Methanomethylovorans sp. PtaU1.Bin093]|jgi:hypothetical protein|nr:hypothetical protein [Methanomethylovorans sp. PtaU1.Bin093]